MTEPLLQQPRTGTVVRIATGNDVREAAVQLVRTLAPRLQALDAKLTSIEQKLDRIITIMQTATRGPT